MPLYDRGARLVRITHILREHPHGITPREIARICGVSTRTIFRDLRALSLEMNVPIWQDGGHYGISDRYFLPPVNLNIQEAVAIFLSSRLAERYSDERNRALISSWGKLASILPAPIARHLRATVSQMAQKPPDPDFDRKVDLVTLAWADSRRLRILYQSVNDVQPRMRLVEPYFLEPSGIGHSLYVIGRDVDVDDLRTYKVERIQGIELTDATFEIPEGFDPLIYLQSSWSVWKDEPVEIELRFTREVAPRVCESVWHPSQVTELQPDGSLLWRARVSGTIEISPWVRSWGPDVEVLAPRELRERIADEARRAAAIYGY